MITACITTTHKLPQRRISIKETWGNNLNHMFFSDESIPSDNVIKVTDDDSLYSNVPKMEGCFKWAHESNGEWFIFGDDDMFVFPNRLRNYIYSGKLNTNFVYGFILSKFTDSPNPIFIKYPDLSYPSGGAGCIIHKNVVDSIWDKIKRDTEYYSDVNVGICLLNNNITLIHETKFHQLNYKDYDSKELESALTFHHMSTNDVYGIYKMNIDY